MRHSRLAAFAALALLTACFDPKDAEGWAERAASRNRIDEKLAALQQARTAPGDKKAAVRPLIEVLKQAPKARAEAALILGEIGDPEAVKPLMEAIDLSGKPERDVNDANQKIASALGVLRAREAIGVLTRLTGSSDPFTQVAAIDALGAVGDPAGVDPLLAVANDEQGEPFAIKKALLALGRIGDPRAIPTILKMLYAERPGAFFFPEAAFAASQLGTPMSAPLAAVVEGRDAELSSWAKAKGVHPAALRAKAAQLLGDVGGPGAVPALLSALSYTDADAAAQLFVHVFAAESLGRLRAVQGVAPIGVLLARSKDPNARDRYAEALARIGDGSALLPLRAAATSGDLDTRDGPLDALSLIGGEAERPLVAGAASRCASGCPATRKATLEGMVLRLDAARACAGEVSCWAGKLKDPNPAVRGRAALEVGRAGNAGQAGPLVEALVRPVQTDAELAARFHAVLGLDWLARRAPLGARGAEPAAAIDKMVAGDKGRTLTAAVNEDALRLAGRLHRTAPDGRPSP
jgi:HEAT repeat protein